LNVDVLIGDGAQMRPVEDAQPLQRRRWPRGEADPVEIGVDIHARL
jgi:hypothetical protein